jgi:hypothetical protein
MTEQEWLQSTNPEAMLNHLTANCSPRKLRLYAIGCCRRIWSLFRDDRCRYAVEVAQRFADGRATAVELDAAGMVVASVARIWGDIGSNRARAQMCIGGAAWATTRKSAWNGAWDAQWDARVAARDNLRGSNWERERAWQATLLRDLFGNPFAPLDLSANWLTSDRAIQSLARVIYEESSFGDLPILADALEEAGCTREDVLRHCRQPGTHYRGCWVVDAVLGNP